jgi:Flp pilus assembly pilin Flp
MLVKPLFLAILGEEGQSHTEYGLILFFIIIAAAVALTLLGQSILALFEAILDAIVG